MSFRSAARTWRYVVGLAALGACAQKKPPPTPPVPVTIATAERRAVPLELPATGTVEPLQTVSVQAQVSGILQRVAFKEGDEVTQGQVLFQLDPRPYRAALDQAVAILARDRAQATNAAQDAKRYEALVQKEYVTSQQYDQARTGAASAEATLAGSQAAVDQARLNLQYATIRAPIAGRTGALMVNAGNLVRANDQAPLVTINQVSPIYVAFAFPEGSLSNLRRYLSLGALRVDAGPGTADGPRAVGRITFVDNAVDQTTGTIKIKATFPNEDRRLWPGQAVNVVVRLATDPAAIVVPTLAVQSGPDGSYVYIVKDDKTVELRPVTVARAVGSETVIQQGLAAGDVVVTDGHLRLVPGSRVSLRDEAGAKAGS